MKFLGRWRKGWQVVDASRIAAGAPAAFGSLSDVEAVVARNTNGRVELYWWSSALDWQLCDLTAITGTALATDPAVWIGPGDPGPKQIAGSISENHLVVLTHHEVERTLTDGL
jgi:hypothetical protein